MQTDQKFQIGDKVRVTVFMEGSRWSSSFSDGEQGVIIGIQPPQGHEEFIAYDVFNGTLSQWHPDYELVKE